VAAQWALEYETDARDTLKPESSGLIFFRKNAKALRFDALIEKKDYVRAREQTNTTPYKPTRKPREEAGDHPWSPP
jgi:hypothetical protein